MSLKRAIEYWKSLSQEDSYRELASELETLRGTHLWAEVVCEYPELIGSQFDETSDPPYVRFLPSYTATQTIQAFEIAAEKVQNYRKSFEGFVLFES